MSPRLVHGGMRVSVVGATGHVTLDRGSPKEDHMLKQRHHRDDLTAEAEARIRADERQRLLAERDGTDDWSTTPTAPNDPAWRTTPPPLDERRDDDRYDTFDRTPEYVTTESDVVHEDVITERGFSPGQVLIMAAGVASLVLGIIAVVRTGLDGSLSDPVETVLWWDHTALLGLFEIGAGVLMILSAMHPAMRWLGGLVGLALIVGGIMILAEVDWTLDELGAERDFGWVPIVIGAVAVIGAAIPRVHRTRRVATTSTHPGMIH
jgi:hypothetical protein